MSDLRVYGGLKVKGQGSCSTKSLTYLLSFPFSFSPGIGHDSCTNCGSHGDGRSFLMCVFIFRLFSSTDPYTSNTFNLL